MHSAIIAVNLIVQAILPPAKIENPRNILDQFVWPSSAEFGISYKVHDRAFPQVKHETEVEFFDTDKQMYDWIAKKREWIIGTDYDFTMEYRIYKWDLGPEFVTCESM